MSTPLCDEVREELGSPSTDDISDATILRLVGEERTLYGAAARCADILARRYAFKVDLAVGDYRESFSDIAKRWQELAIELRRKATLYGAAPFAGGVSGVDAPEPDFRRGMWDNHHT